MRFVFVTDVPVGAHWGNYIFARLPAALIELGHDVVVFAPYPPEFPKEQSMLPSDCLWDITQFNPTIEGDYLCLFISPFFWWWGDQSSILKSFVATASRAFKKVVYWAADCWIAWDYATWALDNERFLIQHSEIHLANSPQNCVRLCNAYGLRRVFWLPNAATQEWFCSPSSEADKSKDVDSFAPPDGRHIVSVISSLSELRGVSKFVESAARFRNLVFIVIGRKQDGGMFPPQCMGGNVFFVGPQDNLVVRKVLQSSLFAIVTAGANWFSYFADPTKWYLYHAAGVPILSLNTPHHRWYPNFYPYTVCSFDYFEGITEILNALEGGKIPLRYQPNPVHDYLHRAQSFIEILEGGNPYGYAEGKQFFTGHYTGGDSG